MPEVFSSSSSEERFYFVHTEGPFSRVACSIIQEESYIELYKKLSGTKATIGMQKRIEMNWCAVPPVDCSFALFCKLMAIFLQSGSAILVYMVLKKDKRKVVAKIIISWYHDNFLGAANGTEIC